MEREAFQLVVTPVNIHCLKRLLVITRHFGFWGVCGCSRRLARCHGYRGVGAEAGSERADLFVYGKAGKSHHQCGCQQGEPDGGAE